MDLSVPETHTSKYEDFIINSFDAKVYPGHPVEKIIPHQGEIHNSSKDTCLYCSQSFSSRNRLFRHLGYCNVDIRPSTRNMKRKLKQIKITNYLKHCPRRERHTRKMLNYEGDTEMDVSEEHSAPTKKRSKTANQTKKVDKAVDIDVISFMMENLSTQKKKSRYNLRISKNGLRVYALPKPGRKRSKSDSEYEISNRKLKISKSSKDKGYISRVSKPKGGNMKKTSVYKNKKKYQIDLDILMGNLAI